MKKFLYIVFFLFTVHTSFAQQDEPPGRARLREKMVEYIQKKLDLNKAEAERFQPLFMNYLNQLQQVKKEYKNDQLKLEKKVIDARIEFRDKVKPVIGEKRSNDVFTHEQEFIKELQKARTDRQQEHPGGRANKRKNSKLQ